MEEGARVVGVARSRQALKEDDACLKNVVESVCRECGHPFGLINNAGAGVYGEPA